MSTLAEFQEWPDQDVPWFSHAEEQRISRFEIPCDKQLGSGRWNMRATFYPRKPKENPGKWFRENAAKLASMERAWC